MFHSEQAVPTLVASLARQGSFFPLDRPGTRILLPVPRYCLSCDSLNCVGHLPPPVVVASAKQALKLRQA